ncbi:MAG: nucleotidyltransferase [Anaerolineae bacterium]|nr:nucleotidyltransferase [Anaerolineae bacterium]
MTASKEIAPLLGPIAALQRLLARFGDQGMVIGGVAASLLGKPRLTADVDAVILLSVEDLPHLMEAAAQEGLLPRIANAEDFARRHRVLLLRHQESGIHVDISLGVLPFEVEAVERSIVHHIGSLAIRLPTPEDLIIFKAVAHRPQDLLDIQAIIESHPDLDRERIRYWVGEFAQVLEMPELWEDIASWLISPRRTR